MDLKADLQRPNCGLKNYIGASARTWPCRLAAAYDRELGGIDASLDSSKSSRGLAPRRSRFLSGGERARLSTRRGLHRRFVDVGNARHAGRSASHWRARDRFLPTPKLDVLDRRRGDGGASGTR